MRPFNHRVSRALDTIILELEAGHASRLRRWYLRLCKRWHERHVPPFGKEAR